MGEQKKRTSRAIGIDLGTTYSCLANLNNGKLSVLSNQEGERITPSVVAYVGNSRVVGSSAVHKMSVAPGNVVYETKRFIGRSYDDPKLVNHLSKYPFKTVRWDNERKCETSVVDPNVKDNIRIIIDKEGKPTHVVPVEISSAVLKYLKTCAEEKLGHPVDTAVITVPAHFNDSQKSRTNEAAQIAGFKNTRLLNEPTAAALAYAYEQINKSIGTNAKAYSEKVFVFDFGGGTLDCTVITFEYSGDAPPFAEVLGISGDTYLGGVDFDNTLYDYFMKVWQSKNIPGEIKDRQKRRLRIACEKAKRMLSTTDVSNIDIECFVGETDFNCTITRAKFNELCYPLLEKCINIVRGALLDCAKINYLLQNEGGRINMKDNTISIALNAQKASINKVILVGGSSRIPKMREMLAEEFGEKRLCYSIHPDEAIAMGAAYQAAIIADDADLSDAQSLFLLDVCPLNISIETAGGIATTIIAKNSTYPIKQSQIFTTYADNQTEVTINVLEGLRPMVKDNQSVGRFTLTGIPQAPRGVPQIEVTIEYDSNGIITVTATDKATSNQQQITIKSDKQGLTKEDVEKMREEAEKYKEEDDRNRAAASARNELETILNSAKRLIEGSNVEQTTKDNDLNTLKEHDNWFMSHPKETEAEYNRVFEEVKKLVEKYAPKNHGGSGQAPGGGFNPEQSGPTDTSNKGPTIEEVD